MKRPFFTRRVEDIMKLLGVILVLAAIAVEGNDDAQYCDICRYHTMCGTTNSGPKCQGHESMPPTEEDKQEILHFHNRYRNKVAKGRETRGNPGPQYRASNMMKVEWDDELAEIAQRLADQCVFDHDCQACRLTRRDDNHIGQNIAIKWHSIRPTKIDYGNLAEGLYTEEVDTMDKELAKVFRFGDDWGHYSQIVWWNSRLVGCGAGIYEDGDWFARLLVCNYRTSGNVDEAKIYEIGVAGTQCPEGTAATDPRYRKLCVIQSSPAPSTFHTDGEVLGLPPDSSVQPARCQEKGFRFYE